MSAADTITAAILLAASWGFNQQAIQLKAMFGKKYDPAEDCVATILLLIALWYVL